MLSVVDRSLAPVLWEDPDSALVQEIHPESSGYTLDVLKDGLRPRDAGETTSWGDEYVLSDAVAPDIPCHIPNPDVVSECGLSELPNSMRGEEPLDETLDPRSRLTEYVDSKTRAVTKRLCYARPTGSSWPLKHGSMGDISQLKDDLERRITTWQ